jgi:hypothetical protein
MGSVNQSLKGATMLWMSVEFVSRCVEGAKIRPLKEAIKSLLLLRKDCPFVLRDKVDVAIFEVAEDDWRTLWDLTTQLPRQSYGHKLVRNQILYMASQREQAHIGVILPRLRLVGA